MKLQILPAYIRIYNNFSVSFLIRDYILYSSPSGKQHEFNETITENNYYIHGQTFDIFHSFLFAIIKKMLLQ